MAQKQLYSKSQQLQTGEVNAAAAAKLDRVLKSKVQKQEKPKQKKAPVKTQITETKLMKVRCAACTNHEYHIHEITVTDKTQIDGRGAVRINETLGTTVHRD